MLVAGHDVNDPYLHNLLSKLRESSLVKASEGKRRGRQGRAKIGVKRRQIGKGRGGAEEGRQQESGRGGDAASLRFTLSLFAGERQAQGRSAQQCTVDGCMRSSRIAKDRPSLHPTHIPYVTFFYGTLPPPPSSSSPLCLLLSVIFIPSSSCSLFLSPSLLFLSLSPTISCRLHINFPLLFCLTGHSYPGHVLTSKVAVSKNPCVHPGGIFVT